MNNNQDKQQNYQHIQRALTGIGAFIGLVIGIWQASGSDVWWAYLVSPVIWIAIIAIIASGIGYGLERAFKNGATVKGLVTYIICGGIGVLIGTWMVFRTLAVYPGSGFWAWVCTLMGASVGLGVAAWINIRRRNSQGA